MVFGILVICMRLLNMLKIEGICLDGNLVMVSFVYLKFGSFCMCDCIKCKFVLEKDVFILRVEVKLCFLKGFICMVLFFLFFFIVDCVF